MQLAVERMLDIFVSHAYLTLGLMALQNGTGDWSHLPISIAIFLNTLCLAERIWHVQLDSMSQWPIMTQFCFVVSRQLVVTIMILALVFCVKTITCL